MIEIYVAEMALNTTELQASDISFSPLTQIGAWFTSVHGYLSLIVCVFGISTNIFNITVLARNDMRTPTNALLTWLAVSDILTMIPYVPFVIHFYCAFTPGDVSPDKYTYHWVMYMMFSINFAALTHTISIWLGVTLAAFRYVQLRTTSKGIQVRKKLYSRIQKVIAVIYILSTLMLIPNYLTNEIEEIVLPDNNTIYRLKDLKLATKETRLIVLVNVVTYALVAKLIPCMLMTFFSGSLLISLNVRGRERRRRLSSSTSNTYRRDSRQSKTTRMLLAVIIIFLITEFPHGILIVISVTVSQFYNKVYMPLGDLMDFIAIVNNSINFVLYCAMSTMFRTKFLQMYFNKETTLKRLERENKPQSLNKTTQTSS